jgi:hypothetical protein
LIIDTNLLLLYVVGTASPDYIEGHKRLSAFTMEDYNVLIEMISQAPAVLVTPNTLTETSNLAPPSGKGDEAKRQVLKVVRQLAESATETYVPSDEAASHPGFVRFGLTDAVLLNGVFGDAVLLTTDLELYNAAIAQGSPAINFSHLPHRPTF